MKHLLLSLFLLFSLHTLSFSQSLETGINFYEEGDYERALRVFDDHDEPLAHLFSGKSYFSLGNYFQAKHHLAKVDSSAIEVYREAQYTLALAEFQLKNFTEALDVLHQIREKDTRESVANEANTFYEQLLSYLTLKQRHQVFKASKYDEVRYNLVESAIGNVDFNSAKSFFQAYKNSTQIIGEDNSRIEALEDMLSDSVRYMQRYNPEAYPEAPAGISYNIGVALPAFDYESSDYEISQNLFFGIQLAIDNFNSENNDKKAFVTYQNTADGPSTAASIANELVWSHGVDAILGPLFSNVAVSFSKYSEMYEVPLLTPLANADTLNLDLSYTFQLNPTFTIHGEKMAQFAVRDMGFDTLAVIAEKGSLGAPSAVAFRDEARELGAEVVHYFVEDFESMGYDISEYTEYLDPRDTVYNYNIDAVYAPFTGPVASTLISAFLTHLEAMRTSMAILGSEDWSSVNKESVNLPGTEIYYSQSFAAAGNDTLKEDFASSFRLRFDVEPDYYAYVGYDAANVLLETLKRVKNPANLKEGLKKLNNYQGLITNVSFRNTHINQEVKIRRVRE